MPDTDELFAAHAHLAPIYAGALRACLPRRVSRDELEAVALEGIWRAALTWDTQEGLNFSSWAGRCARWAMLDWLRDCTPRRQSTPGLVSLACVADRDKSDFLTIGDCLADTRDRGQRDVDDRDHVNHLLRLVKPRHRLLLRCLYQEGLLMCEIAEATGVPDPAVSVMHSGILRRLRREFDA